MQEHFNYQAEGAVEYPLGSNRWHIPINTLKAKLSKDFVSWGTENCKTQIILRGNDIIISNSLELNLTFQDPFGVRSSHKFVGAITFKDSDYTPNEDYEGIAIAESLKNAAKNIGRAYNPMLDVIQNISEPSPSPKKKNNMKISINEIIKNQ
jgi:hypothetical protein